MRRTIYVKNEEVNKIFNETTNVSNLIEESVLYYSNNKKAGLLTEEQVRSLFCDLVKAWLSLVHNESHQ